MLNRYCSCPVLASKIDKVNYGSRQAAFFIIRPYDPTFGLSANNVVKTVGRYNNDFDNSTVTTYEYTYDDDSYPVTRKDSTQVIRGGPVSSAYHESFRYRYMIRQAKPY